MGWFDAQIRERIVKDNEAFDEAFRSLAGSVMGQRITQSLKDDRTQTLDALNDVLKFYHLKTEKIPEELHKAEEQMEYLFRPHGIMRRTVKLSEGWHRDAIGAMLGTKKSDGSLVALLPDKFRGYRYFDRETEKYVKIDRKNENLFEREALCFYKPFPMKEISQKEFWKYLLGLISVSDVLLFGLAVLGVTVVGLLLPKLNSLIFSRVIVEGNLRVVVAMTLFLLCVSFSQLAITSVKTLLMVCIKTKMEIAVEAAVMMRILSLPADFFKKYSSGELTQRAQYVGIMCERLVMSVLDTGLVCLFSLLYLSQIFTYAPSLTAPSLAVILVTLAFSVASALWQAKISKKQMEAASKESGMSYALISGIQKIRLSGAEKRAFARWARLYEKEARLQYDPPLFLKANTAIAKAIMLVGTFSIEYLAIQSGISVSSYYAFNTAFGMVSGAFTSLSSVALSIANIQPVLEMLRPMLETKPEVDANKQVISRLSGGIELNNVSFRYKETMPWVLDNLSLKIRPGQYVAIVGKTGCGKSTLMRLLLGFEKPQKGSVYYDGRDLETMDLKSLRRKIGVVLQNGKLFQGDVYSNIVISAPELDMDAAWEAARMAGMEEDIRHMPMGMHTLISEGSGGISGGQRQRIMIARAIAPRPRILMFDEATSALDNLTQKQVSDSLESLKCTRIVIAHRLSTIRHCDRIIVLDKGKIIEDGTYEELTAQNGFFAELVERQRVDVV